MSYPYISINALHVDHPDAPSCTDLLVSLSYVRPAITPGSSARSDSVVQHQLCSFAPQYI